MYYYTINSLCNDHNDTEHVKGGGLNILGNRRIVKNRVEGIL